MADFTMVLFYFAIVMQMICLAIAVVCTIAWLVIKIVLGIIDQLKQRRRKFK